ncbi:NADH dehydrogenase [ubiquinone] 1 beta subcomplex subunit 4 [Ictalurus punctatus]|uniref:NADH dehydrogenase [ubiquinone] 1 beta subcomplex subunit 4 n=3 Tax=Ictalurus TaxID=7997 RepID=E3TDZ1_ICTPU|nr:NADH dehydrogenase [ubiquinone] 1 beta subcomplex subunit 4 [Ictalurus punctatus]ADO28261.1 NADH dehydrogenase 1 beta subcomplex subunit 4 [Ictalurus furcatus]ADO28527.1 NADH dehydrogenase (ubiquinone) 1 beta subcomplex subunit 4 [Ictalurus punctatus]
MADYKEAPLATRPKTLEPAEYFHVSPEYRRAEEERGALRSRLKREYQTKLNNPLRKELIEDPALTRWTYARTEMYNHFRPTPKSSLIAGLIGVAPLFILYYVLKTDRDKREQKIKDGTYKRPYRLSY